MEDEIPDYDRERSPYSELYALKDTIDEAAASLCAAVGYDLVVDDAFLGNDSENASTECGSEMFNGEWSRSDYSGGSVGGYGDNNSEKSGSSDEDWGQYADFNKLGVGGIGGLGTGGFAAKKQGQKRDQQLLLPQKLVIGGASSDYFRHDVEKADYDDNINNNRNADDHNDDINNNSATASNPKSPATLVVRLNSSDPSVLHRVLWQVSNYAKRCAGDDGGGNVFAEDNDNRNRESAILSAHFNDNEFLDQYFTAENSNLKDSNMKSSSSSTTTSDVFNNTVTPWSTSNIAGFNLKSMPVSNSYFGDLGFRNRQMKLRRIIHGWQRNG